MHSFRTDFGDGTTYGHMVTVSTGPGRFQAHLTAHAPKPYDVTDMVTFTVENAHDAHELAKALRTLAAKLETTCPPAPATLPDGTPVVAGSFSGSRS